MKNSEMYRLAQLAVLESKTVSDFDKIEILRELMDKEDVAIYC